MEENNQIIYAFNEATDNRIREYVSNRSQKETIYPGTIAKELSLPLEVVYAVLEELRDEQKLTSFLESWCPNCQKFTGSQYGAFWDVPSKHACVHCGYVDTETYSDTIVVYQRTEEENQ